MIPARLPVWRVEWLDRGVEANTPAHPDYPNGVDHDISNGADNTCKMPVPYPALRRGYYLITCRTCGNQAVVTTAGRRDDPRSLKMACKHGAN